MRLTHEVGAQAGAVESAETFAAQVDSRGMHCARRAGNHAVLENLHRPPSVLAKTMDSLPIERIITDQHPAVEFLNPRSGFDGGECDVQAVDGRRAVPTGTGDLHSE